MKKYLKVLMVFCMPLILFLILSVDAKAYEYPSVTIKKKSSKSIQTILKSNPLTKPNYSTYKKLEWKSKNSSIVSIQSNKIVGEKQGSTFIRGYKNKKKVIAIKVIVGTPVKEIKVSNSSIVMDGNQKLQIKCSVNPKKASNKKMFYESSNTKIVKVSTKGVITPVKGGTAKVYINSKDTNKKKTVSVKVNSLKIRNTQYGKIKGKTVSEALAWYGVPYGADTSGKNRWRAPQEPVSWSGTKLMTTQKEPAAQYGDGNTSYIGTEDCLYVNIFRPDTVTENLPVMVYLHGGGNATGNSNRNFSYFAKETNCVVVAVEYRLGAFGFLSHPALRNGTKEENSGNFTMLDIQKALQWIQTNIGYFGGNKNNVTLTGYSAGARDVMFCIISPIMKGLFQKAITFSGGCKTCTNEQGEKSFESKLASVLVKRGNFSTNKEALNYIQNQLTDVALENLIRSLTTEEVANMYKSPSLRLNEFPQGFTDGTVISADGFDAIKRGDYNRVDLILGSNTSEFTSFAYASQYIVAGEEATTLGVSTQELLRRTIQYGSLLQTYHYIEEPAKLLMSDPLHKQVYAYRFNWGTNPDVVGNYYANYVGATHGMDVNFLLGFYPNHYTQYAPTAISTSNEKGRLALTKCMRSYIKNFLKKGDPNSTGLNTWVTWNEQMVNKVMWFDADKTSATSSMTNSYYNQDDIFSKMRVENSKEIYEILTDYSLKGRFFMPDLVPEYEKKD